ncbi:MAG TPA: CoA ester lyase [Polyangiaceae bacterium]|nr:CoA ester lyase [Polyangiaceae bacterium]
MSIVRPRRSALYVPGSNERALQKSGSLEQDIILFDLEDSVAPDEKGLARAQACQAVRIHQQRHEQVGSKELVIRVNGGGTPWYQDDLREAVDAHPDAILLPKVDDPRQIVAAVRELEALGARADIALWAMVETPLGVLNVANIAASHQRLTCLVMGTSDLTNDLRALHTSDRLPLLASLGICILAARAHQKTILDGVSLDLSDEAAFVKACQQGRELGFDGKTLIHPRQIGVCNEAFSPTEAEAARAYEVIAAFEAASAAGRGVTVVRGQLIEEMHVRDANRILALSAAIAGRRPSHRGT